MVEHRLDVTRAGGSIPSARTMNDFEVEEYRGSLEKLIDFYKDVVEFTYEPVLDERVFVAKKNGEIIGAVRMCIDHGSHMLRTMQVRPEAQRSGVGSALLQMFDANAEQKDYYCIAFAHLAEFYGRIGFTAINKTEAPAFLQERLEEYRAKDNGLEFVIMKRPAEYSN